MGHGCSCCDLPRIGRLKPVGVSSFGSEENETQKENPGEEKEKTIEGHQEKANEEHQEKANEEHQEKANEEHQEKANEEHQEKANEEHQEKTKEKENPKGKAKGKRKAKEKEDTIEEEKEKTIEENQNQPTKKTIVVHNGQFHADDALAVYFLHQTKEFKGSRVIRTRDPSIIDSADIVCDVGGVYDHQRRRYDHHQKDYNQKFPKSSFKCASCGLIYIHYGHEIINNILQDHERNPGKYHNKIYNEMYHSYVKEIDAIDNGIHATQEKPQYSIKTGISNRIHQLNPIHNKHRPYRKADDCFQDAVNLIGQEFEDALLYYFDNDIETMEETKQIVLEAFQNCFNIDESGQIIFLRKSCNYEEILRNLEKSEREKAKNEGKRFPNEILYVIFPSKNEFTCMTVRNYGKPKKPFPCNGLQDEELSDACGIPGGIFVHANAYMAKFKGKQNMIDFAKYALNYSEEPVQNSQNSIDEEQNSGDSQDNNSGESQDNNSGDSQDNNSGESQDNNSGDSQDNSSGEIQVNNSENKKKQRRKKNNIKKDEKDNIRRRSKDKLNQ